VSNATLWFLHHGLFDLPRRPRFDERFREAWDARDWERVAAVYASECRVIDRRRLMRLEFDRR
jgi:hypothetical protein